MPRGKKANGEARSDIKKGKYTSDTDGEVEWGGYINVVLSEEEKRDYQKWSEEHATDIWKLLEDLLSEGLKYGLSYDTENTCYIATFTGNAVSVDDKRYCLTARSGLWGDATSLLVYKHLVLAKGDWASYRPRQRRFDNWG